MSEENKENKESKYFSASCNLNFTAGSYEEACDQLLDYLKDSVNNGETIRTKDHLFIGKNRSYSNWFINEE